ncbi:MAG: CHAT domain-containing protein, partial [Verrucomicrobiota bacterium]
KRLQQLRQEVEEHERAHDECLGRIRRIDPGYDPDQPVPPATWEEILQRIPEKGLAVSFYVLAEETVAFLVAADGRVEVVRFPSLDGHTLGAMATEWGMAYHGQKIVPQHDHRGKREKEAVWREVMESTMARLSRELVSPLEARIRAMGDFDQLILCLHQTLHAFPLHACQVGEGDAVMPLLDAYQVSYIPSFSLWRRCQERQNQEGRQEGAATVLFGDPTGDLTYARLEVAATEELLAEDPERPLHAYQGPDVTRKVLRTEAPDMARLIYSGHSFFQDGDPLESALVLQTKEPSPHWLRLREIFASLPLPKCVEVVLNGCESGRLRPDAADEYVSLPTGFLFRGATRVVSTLWAIYDTSAALLMVRYHELSREGLASAEALRQAQRWLRDLPNGEVFLAEALPRLVEPLKDPVEKDTYKELLVEAAKQYGDEPPFAHPIHWAAFTVAGEALGPVMKEMGKPKMAVAPKADGQDVERESWGSRVWRYLFPRPLE